MHDFHHLFAVGLAFAAWGCDALVLTWFEQGRSGTGEIPGVPGGAPLAQVLAFPELAHLDLTAGEDYGAWDLQAGDIHEAHLVELELSTDDVDLSFLDRVDIYAEAAGLPMRLVAWQDAFPGGETTVPFEIEDVDLTRLVLAGDTTLHAWIEGKAPVEDAVLTLYARVGVGVTPQGACNASRS